MNLFKTIWTWCPHCGVCMDHFPTPEGLKCEHCKKINEVANAQLGLRKSSK